MMAQYRMRRLFTLKAHNVLGTDGSDQYSSLDNKAFIYRGLEGNDYVSGSRENDELYGGEGDDSLQGRDGNDILAGGTGNDRLEGGIGDDIYIFNRGNGVDMITSRNRNGCTNESRSGTEKTSGYFLPSIAKRWCNVPRR